jgi:hypothetical protein
VEGFFRRARPISDVRPPPPAPAAVPCCVRCGRPVSRDQRLDRGEGPEHLICDAAIVSDLDRRLEAGRALHRALGALGALEPLRERVGEERKTLPDVIDPVIAAELLARMHTAVEVARFPRVEQRKLAISLLEALSRRLSEIG